MKADLHMHSTNSDGKLTPFEVIDRAKSNKMDVIALTDHDIIKDVEELKQYAKEKNILFLPGIELSTKHLGKPVHILGYFTDASYLKKEFVEYKKNIKKRREDRSKEMIQRLTLYHNIEISYEEILEHSSGIIARPHIAKAIVNKYPQYTMDDVFEQFICDNCKAYVPSAEMGVKEGLDFLKENHCITVLAHPKLLKDHIKDYVLSLDFDGIEAVYFLHDQKDEEFYRRLAQKRGMIITAGSDYHGIVNDTRHGDIGEKFLTGNDLELFLRKVQG